jgi:hypothetical protein
MESQGRAHGELVDSAHRASYPLVSLPRKINTSGQMSQRPEAASATGFSHRWRPRRIVLGTPGPYNCAHAGGLRDQLGSVATWRPNEATSAGLASLRGWA